MAYNVVTNRGHNLFDIMSLLQKAIRRGDRRLTGYAVCEMHPTYYRACWRRLMVIGAEDVDDPVHTEIMSLFQASEEVNKGKKAADVDCLNFLLKAAFLLCDACKSRDTDNFIYVHYKKNKITEQEVEQAIAELEESERLAELPEYVYDKHTLVGKRKGDTTTKFIFRETEALKPRAKSILFGPVSGENYD
jgi:replication-associated recombination protein RarA